MSVEKEEFKPGGARAGPEDACAACWVRTGRRSQALYWYLDE